MTRAGKFRSIQALRALAALGVVAYHTNGLVMGAGWLPHFFHAASLYGEIGVDIFFVISGFVIATVTHELPTGFASARSFIAARLARVVPLYWVLTALFIALVVFAPQALVNVPLSVGHTIASLLFIPAFNHAGKIEPDLYVGWTLQYEMWFYLIFAVALCFLRRRILGVGLFLVATCLLNRLPVPGAAFATYTNPLVLEFVFGCGLGWWYAMGRRIHPVAGIAALAIALGSHELLRPVLTEANRFWVFGLPALALVALCLSIERRVRWGALSQTIGDASYSLYLTHVFAVPIGIRSLLVIDSGHRMRGDLACVFVVLVSVAIGLASYRWLERPLLALFRRAGKVRARAVGVTTP